MRWPWTTITQSIHALEMALRRPLLFRHLVAQEFEMLVYSVTAGAPVDADVTIREMVAVIDGVVVSTNQFSGSATDLGEVKAPQGASVVLTLTDIDDAGNRSQPAVVEFTATDTIPPAQPGQFGATVVREEP